jgi:hypothetical protein
MLFSDWHLVGVHVPNRAEGDCAHLRSRVGPRRADATTKKKKTKKKKKKRKKKRGKVEPAAVGKSKQKMIN